MPEKDPQEKPEEKKFERPLECTECKRPIVYHYTEIVGDKQTCLGMCSECPVLHSRMHGLPSRGERTSFEEGKTGLACGECRTTLDSVRRGSPLGCSVCYEVFGDVLFTEMLKANKIAPVMIKKRKKSVALHIGRTPGETLELSPSLQLLALNEALDETLKREDYEQAAWLRDQIKALTEEKKKENE